MESVTIHENNCDIVVYLDQRNFFGYKFNNDYTTEKINKNVFKYFDFFICSSNYTVLPNVADYKVVLDNDTNFKHYFKGGSEDYLMFFKNNGKAVFNYQNPKVNDMNSKLYVSFKVKDIVIYMTYDAYKLLFFHANYISNHDVDNKNSLRSV